MYQKCIFAHNFGPIGPNFTNEVPLESLQVDEDIASYDVIGAILDCLSFLILSKTFKKHFRSRRLSDLYGS